MSSSSFSSGSSLLSPDHLPPPPSEKLCYVHCNICDTVLAVSVPCSSLFKTVTVRCGHCTNLLPVNMRALLLPSANQLHLGHHSFFPPGHHNLLEEMPNSSPNYLMNQANLNIGDFSLSARASGFDEIHRPPVINRPPEKRQRVPSAYNRFIKDEIQRIKAANPDISHREAFSAAAKNWAHFPHIHFGLMTGDSNNAKKNTTVCQQDNAEDILMKDGYFPSANIGVSPY
ncbi:hypothetical protein DCAR_0831661 [Daucus carota subsp. sativus]|uniref:Uncharacterized protein n=1 Tax=Daucus carota subsp. sativus TaxID=79200 RepID=A0A175YN40_DAUCS|nr:PREDICTED: protein YABBY 4-like [Daucus carota subsp. sativus]WOH12162.1 hypothetical protein DCAR_0831661 [Daucus carota subsp. sativus]